MHPDSRAIAGSAGALATVLLAVALVAAGLLAAACGQARPAASAAPAAPAVATAPQVAAESPSQTPPSVSASPTFDPGADLDQVDSDLSSIRQILGGVDSSVSDSAAGAGGGE